jgi:hypothetical protein
LGGGAAYYRQANTDYIVGKVRKNINDDPIICVTEGTSGSGEPSWGSPNRGGNVDDGTVVWEYLFGHLHDGRDLPHCGTKILLTGAEDVTGNLPITNQVEHLHSGAGGQFAKIHPYSHILNVSESEFNAVFSNSQFTTEQTITIRYRLHQTIESAKPDVIWLSCGGFSATSNGYYFLDDNAPIPTAIRPYVDLSIPVVVIDNGVEYLGGLNLFANGDLGFGILTVSSPRIKTAILDQTAFTNSGAKGFKAFSLQYTNK